MQRKGPINGKKEDLRKPNRGKREIASRWQEDEMSGVRKKVEGEGLRLNESLSTGKEIDSSRMGGKPE